MILVTGASGYVGGHLMARLKERGEAIRPLVRDLRAAERLRGAGVEPAVGNIADPASLRRAMEGVDTVIHLVAIIVEKGDATFGRINAQGTRNVVAAAQAAGVKRFLYMSENGAQDNPRYPYLQSKWQGEQAVIAGGIPYAILRPSLIFGSGDRFFNTLAALVRGNPIVPIVGDGKSPFQPVWVEDVCTCFVKMLDDDSYLGREYNVGGPEQLSYEEMVDIVMRVLGKRRPKIHLPIALMKPAATVMQAVLPKPPVTPGQLDLLAVPNTTAPNPLPALFGIERPAYLQAKLDYIKGR
jgi:uncharacterized protein YbjT (DUF2867 family)